MAVGFLLAAKSVFRFGDLRDGTDRRRTQYFLVGTLLSFAIAFVAALCARRHELGGWTLALSSLGGCAGARSFGGGITSLPKWPGSASRALRLSRVRPAAFLGVHPGRRTERARQRFLVRPATGPDPTPVA